MLSEMPKSWTSKRLGDVCAINMGQSPKSSDVNTERQGMPFLQGCAEFGDYTPTPKAWMREPIKVAQAGDILFSVRAPVGKMNIAPAQLSIGRGLCAINSKSIEQTFLRYLLAYITPKISSQSQGSTFQAVNKKQIKDALVSLPPLNEQHRISEILSSVDAGIQATQAVIEQAERVKQGLMEELLTGGLGSAAIEQGVVPEGWSELSFGELTSIVGGTTPKKNVEEYWDSEDILWATPTDITSLPEGSHFLHDTATKASISAAERGGLKILPADTVLMTSRATIGYVAIAKSEMSTNQGFANFLPSDKFIPLFLLYLLHSKRDQFINSAGGSTFKEISKGTLKSLTTLLPPLNEQKRIADILASVDDFVAKHRAVIEQNRRIKRGLMDDLLTGKVRTV